MTTAFAILKAFAAAFSVSPWLRTTAFVLIAFSFGFVKGCNTGRSWAKQPEPARVVRPERRPILPWRQAEVQPVPDPISTPVLPELPPIADQFVDANKMVGPKPKHAVSACGPNGCAPMRRGLFGRWR